MAFLDFTYPVVGVEPRMVVTPTGENPLELSGLSAVFKFTVTNPDDAIHTLAFERDVAQLGTGALAGKIASAEFLKINAQGNLVQAPTFGINPEATVSFEIRATLTEKLPEGAAAGFKIVART